MVGLEISLAHFSRAVEGWIVTSAEVEGDPQRIKPRSAKAQVWELVELINSVVFAQPDPPIWIIDPESTKGVSGYYDVRSPATLVDV